MLEACGLNGCTRVVRAISVIQAELAVLSRLPLTDNPHHRAQLTSRTMALGFELTGACQQCAAASEAAGRFEALASSMGRKVARA